MFDCVYDEAFYVEVEGIKMYSGITSYSEKHLKYRIKQYADDEEMLSILEPSISTVNGQLSNIRFNEKTAIHKWEQPSGDIIRIISNFGDLYNPNYKKPEEKKTKRGRKPKNKPKSSRKQPGNGTCFSSQYTFDITEQEKIFRIKLFMPGKLGIPGSQNPSMVDVIKPTMVLRDYVRKQFKRNDIDITYLIAVMRNAKCKLAKPNIYIKLTQLENVLRKEKDKYLVLRKPVVDKVTEIFGEHAEGIIEYLHPSYDEIGIAEIHHNREKNFGLKVKFKRPNIKKHTKRATIKILKSGKINFIGGYSSLEIEELYLWVNRFLCKYANEVLYDPKNTSDHSTSDCSDESIYDDNIDNWPHDVIYETHDNSLQNLLDD
jgi:hypothetical protein